jgi:hypothetical protein
MSNRRIHGGVAAWFVGSYAFILFGLILILLYGTGVFRNWGKRGQEQEAEQALYKALVRLDQGKLGDMSGSFQAHEAGRVAKNIYQFLRDDQIQRQKLKEELERVPKTMPGSHEEADKRLPALKRVLQIVDEARKEREVRGGKLMIHLKDAAKTSDRLNARYLSISRDFTEKDNLYGAPEYLLDLQFTRLRNLIKMHEILAEPKVKWSRTESLEVIFDPAAIKETAIFESAQREIELNDREMLSIERAMNTAVAAEREGMRRRLGL